MAETRKQKGVAQLKRMATRWAEKDGEFRQYISWRAETLKLLGAGNSSGVFAVAVFLTTGTRTDGLLTAGKWCLMFFAVGFFTFFAAYRTLYRCAGHIEDALIALRHGSKIESAGVTSSVDSAITESERSGLLVMFSTGGFLVGLIIALIGLLSI